ncbi:hypothetical protein SAMN05444003_1219 [Cognatiyoonia sediminum]|uniref:Uncharacterized protein n=1 Tax=Cognatiyoonia sediminum TaxID=1508389 RepID=A0A1M5N716_9RHOB|nr:hypothetical protein [Cognatiyoonia sediminum]SHG85245.1 hypothetical protein SAMN05444003_1219 [Cognatiyoonia sediminum]
MATGTKAFVVAALMALVAVSASQGQARNTPTAEQGEGASAH